MTRAAELVVLCVALLGAVAATLGLSLTVGGTVGPWAGWTVALAVTGGVSIGLGRRWLNEQSIAHDRDKVKPETFTAPDLR